MHAARAALIVLLTASAAALGAPASLHAQEPADAAPADTAAPEIPPADTVAAPADTAAAAPAAIDTVRQKVIDRTPLFPEDVDPYTPLGVGPPSRVIERDELSAWPEATLADVLPRLVALTTDDQGGPGFFQDVRFPSGGPGETRITVDGRPLESPLGPAADLRTVPVLAIERIEIRPGASPAAGAEAGWINVVTRTHLTPQANSGLSFEIGSFDREGFGGWLGRWLGRRVSVFGTLQFDDSQTFTDVASADRSRFWLKGRVYVAREHFLEAAYGTSGVTTDAGGGRPGFSPFVDTEDRRERRLQLLYRGRWGPVQATLSGFSDRFEEREAFTIDGASLLTGSFDRRGVRLAARFGVPGGRAELGARALDEDPDADVPPFVELEGAGDDEDSLGVREAIRTLGAFAGMELALDSLRVHARGELLSLDAAGESATEPTLALEARWAAPAGLTPFARVGRTARGPSLVERAVLARAGVSDLLPIASAREARAGLGWRRGGVHVEVAGFTREGSEGELWLPPTTWRGADGAEDVRLEPGGEEGEAPFGDLNLVDLRARGAEARLRVPLPLDVVGEGVVRVQTAEDEGGTPLPYVPEVVALGRLEWERRFFPSRNLRVRTAVDGRVTGARETLAGETLPAHGLVDGLLRVQLIGFSFGLDVHNALDLRYRTEEGFSLPGRVIGFEVLWEFWN